MQMEYLYNGVNFPDIYTVYTPELQKTHPFAFIAGDSLILSDKQAVVDYISRLTSATAERYVIIDGNWSHYKTFTGAVTFGMPVWSNYDVYTTDGTRYLDASDPIPVGSAPDIDPLLFMAGLRMGQIVRGMRGQKPDVFTIAWDGEVTEPNYNEYYCRVTERIFSKEELLNGKLIFGGEEYTITEDLINNQNVHSSNDTGSYWIGNIGKAMLVTGKAGDYYVGLAGIKSFTLPANGTYFVRRWDTDGMHTERLALPNAVANPAEYLINISWGGDIGGMTVVTLGTVVWAKVSNKVYTMQDLRYSYATFGTDGREVCLDAGAGMVEMDGAVVVSDDAYIFSAYAGTYTLNGVTLAVPEDGTYFLKGNTTYVSSLVKVLL